MGSLPEGGLAQSVGTPVIRTSDTTLFFKLFDKYDHRPPAAVLQRDYLDAGSDGLRQFIPERILSADALAKEVATDPQIYEQARGCAKVLPKVASRVAAALQKLRRIYPEAKTPPITILIGRNNSAGTTGADGVLIGLERACSADNLQSNLEDRMVYLISHEYIHVQQAEPDGNPNLLGQSFIEGVADFLGELISGEASNSHLARWISGREPQTLCAFNEVKTQQDYGAWLYKGVGTPEHPGDLGYWVGYRVAKAWYDQQGDKRAAVRALLDPANAAQIAAESGVFKSCPA